MRHIITTLLTTTLVLVTSVVFSQADITEIGDSCGTNIITSRELTRNTIESSFRIKARKSARQKFAENLRRIEKNKPGYQKSNYQSITDEPFDYEICVPVVFNIVHDGDPLGSQYNPTDENILALLDMLNAQFDPGGILPDLSDSYGVVVQPTGFSFVLGGSDGTANTAIRRFDKTDPNNEYIVYGNPDIPNDDLPDPTCGVISWPVSESFAANYQSRIAYEPEQQLNIYIVRFPTPWIAGFSYYPWFQTTTFSPPEYWEGDFSQPYANYGVFLNAGWCSANGNSISVYDGFTYNDVASVTGTETGRKFRRLISHEVGHYLGLMHTFQDPDWDLLTQSDYYAEPPGSDDCDNPEWPTVVWMSQFDNTFPDPNGGGTVEISLCSMHGDGCCDTKWSSSGYEPLEINWFECSTVASELASGNPNPSACEELTMDLHIENEAENRRNVMNYGGGCGLGLHEFTQDQIERMHDMTNTYRQDVIALGSQLCTEPEVEPVYGCIDPIACNYYEPANTSDGSCFYDCCPECLMDFNNDGLISVFDLVQFLNVFNTVCPE